MSIARVPKHATALGKYHCAPTLPLRVVYACVCARASRGSVCVGACGEIMRRREDVLYEGSEYYWFSRAESGMYSVSPVDARCEKCDTSRSDPRWLA